MIELHHLSHRYGSRPILDDLTVRIPTGSFCAVMGANGSGKTTLLRCVAGLLRPTSGAVTFDGHEVQSLPPRLLAQQVAIVRQHPDAALDFTAEEVVMMGRNPHQRPLQGDSDANRAVVQRVMRQTHTWHLRQALPSELSGGELQRLMIARALAQETPVLLLDEPTSNLDIAHQFEILSLLREVGQREGKTILLVVHDLNLAYSNCPEVLLLHDGRVFFHGPTAEGLNAARVKTVFGVRAEARDGRLLLFPLSSTTDVVS